MGPFDWRVSHRRVAKAGYPTEGYATGGYPKGFVQAQGIPHDVITWRGRGDNATSATFSDDSEEGAGMVIGDSGFSGHDC